MNNYNIIKEFDLQSDLIQLVGIANDRFYFTNHIIANNEFVLFITDEYLNILHQKKYVFNNYRLSFLRSLEIVNDNELLFVGSFYNDAAEKPENSSELVLISSNYEGDFNWIKSYYIDSFNFFLRGNRVPRIKKIDNNYFIICVGHLILKIDVNGNVIKSIGEDIIGANEVFGLTDFTYRNNKILLISNNPKLNHTNVPAEVFGLTTLDTNLNVIESCGYYTENSIRNAASFSALNYINTSNDKIIIRSRALRDGYSAFLNNSLVFPDSLDTLTHRGSFTNAFILGDTFYTQTGSRITGFDNNFDVTISKEMTSPTAFISGNSYQNVYVNHYFQPWNEKLLFLSRFFKIGGNINRLGIIPTNFLSDECAEFIENPPRDDFYKKETIYKDAISQEFNFIDLAFTVNDLSFSKLEDINYEAIRVCPKFDLTRSTIDASTNFLIKNSTNKSIITIEIKDINGNKLLNDFDVNVFSNDGLSLIPIQNFNGKFITELDSNRDNDQIELFFSIDGEISTNTVIINFLDLNNFRKVFTVNGQESHSKFIGNIKNNNYLFFSVDDQINILETDQNLLELSKICLDINDFSFANGGRINTIIEGPNDSKILVGNVDFKNLLIICLDINNNILWHKKYSENQNDNLINPVIKKLTNSKYVIHTSQYLLTINTNGDIIETVEVPHSIRQFLIYQEKIILSLYFGASNNYLILDSNLNILDRARYHLGPLFQTIENESILVEGDNLIISMTGGFSDATKNYLAKINLKEPFPESIIVKSFVEPEKVAGSRRRSRKLIDLDDGFLKTSVYTSSVDDSIVHKFNYDLDLLWSKRIKNNKVGEHQVNYFFDNNSLLYQSDYSGYYTRINRNFDDNCFEVSDLTSFFEFENITLNNYPFNFQIPKGDYLKTEISLLTISDCSLYSFNRLCPPINLSLNNSEIEALPSIIRANGESNSKIYVKLYTDNGEFIHQENFQVNIITSKGSMSSTTRTQDGIYTATLTSLEPGEAIVSFVVDGEMSPNTITVQFSEAIEITPAAQVQSPHIYLQAAGSVDGDGDQSTPGIHLRWTLKNKLGDEHVPKGNLATSNANFNKPDDYVRVYRAPYVKEQLIISLADEPQTINNDNAFWLYTINSNKYYVLFNDKTKYQQVLENINPENGNRLGFLNAYGDGLIEVETRDQLAFGVTLTTNHQTSTSSLQTEILSVEANRLSLGKNVIGRKTFTSTALNDTHQCGDNIRSVRFKASNCYVTTIELELYQTFIETTNEAQNWVPLGDFSLTTSDEEAFQRLEGAPDTIHGKWPRYNNNCLTNIDNYRDKWNGPREEGDRNLKQIVEKYIELSNTEGNPRALETIDFTDPSVTEGLRDLQEVSNLNMLFLAGTDYHMARMMGLGHLDIAIEDDNQKFVYMVEYHTEANLDGSPILGGGMLNPQGVQHLYMTVPTSKQDTRLPYPVDLLKIEPGIKRTGLDQNSTLTDPNGYTDVGRQRYLSIYAKEQVEHENESFYETTDEFNYSEATHPVYAGISYKEKGAENDWVKPEISSSADYLTAGSSPTSETVPLPIPLMGEPLFVHRVLEEGTHEYLGYGINWFGRSNVSLDTPLEIRTEFPAINLLKPPAALHALHIVDEDPLILTSASEQIRVDHNDAEDPTMARLMFGYNHEQELINYPISSDDRALFTDAELLASDIFRPDQNEIFANEIEVFFRDTIPQNIRGKIITAEDDSLDQAVSVLTTGDYTLYSEKVKNEETGEYEFVTIKPELPEGIAEANFTGGVLILGQQQFIVHSVSVDGNGYAQIKVYKKAVGDALQGNTTDGSLEGPDISGDEIFMAIENMLTVDSWGTGNPSGFKIQIPEEVGTIHRALVETNGGSDVNELLLEKFRGIYDDTVTITPVLETSEVDENNEETASIHRGTYKIQLSKTLTQHPQFNATGNSVEWQGGSVRIPSEANPNGAKRTLKVVKIENVGTTDGLVLYAIDDTFDQEVLDPDTGNLIGYQSADPIQTTGDITVNFYPGYKVYLYADTNFGLTSDALQPSEGESLAYSIFGVRVKGDEYSYSESNPPVFVETHYSNIGTPANMFSLAVIPPLRPQLPAGSDYATRPDSFGKATYTLTTTFNHKPFAVQYSRADEQGILNAIYEPVTINAIKNELNSLSKDIYATSRWKNLIGFDYSEQGGEFEKFPNAEHGYRFPNPDKAILFQLINNDIEKYNREESPADPIEPVIAGAINPGTVIIPGSGANDDTTLADYIEKAVLEVFIPLTEIPLIYDQISNDSNYQPINKKQVIRDENGKLLKPTDGAYDIAPMAKRTASGNQLQFTDFTLDGTSNNIYFYAVRELSSAMQMGDFSPVIGPVNLVNTNPPVAPEIRRAIPRLADKEFGLKKIPLDFVSVENLTITGDTIVHEGGIYGGAASKQILEGNAKISYKVKEASTIIIGVSEIHINKETETVDYGFICTQNGDLIVRDKGELIPRETYDSDTLLEIQRIGNKLQFLRNGVEVYQIEIETPIDLIVTVSVRDRIATVTNLALYTSGRYYDREVLKRSTSEPLPLTVTNLVKSTFSPEGILAKDTFLPTIDAWDSSATSLEFIPLCGSLSCNVQSNKIVAIGLTTSTIENHFDAIQYGIRTGDDGLLYVINKGENEVQGVPYDENSRITIERRNQQLLFKNNGRTFYKILLEENTSLLAQFSIYSNDGTISDIEFNETSNVEKNYLDTNVTVPAVTLEFNGYPANQKITALSLYRTLDPAKSSSVRSMDLVKTVDVRLTGQVGQTSLYVIDEFEDLLQIPYGDAIYYRATVSREVSYTIEEGVQEKMITELAPSNASRLVISTITESTNPITPEIVYDIDESAGDASGENISLTWKRTTYNPTYFVYKMNTQGNWVKIHEFENNEDVVYIPLANTSLTPEELSIIDGESDTVFHHFRVDVENSAGLFNITKNLLTIPSDKQVI